jgi:glycosyltransferase involved in cell wall biosynthesis
MSRLVLFFPVLPFYEFHLNKDVGLFVKYFSKHYFDRAEILKAGMSLRDEYETDSFSVKNLLVNPRLYSGEKISIAYQIKCAVKSLLYLLKNKDITHVMFFHITHYSVYASLLIKVLLRRIKIYIKLDTAIDGAEKIALGLTQKSSLGCSIKRWLFPRIELVSVETSAPHIFLRSTPWFKHIELIPNGLDDDYVDIAPEDIERYKTNTIITVGRLGSYQKNTEMILSILKDIDLKDWQVVLIGPVEKQENDFQEKIDEFYRDYPSLVSKVHFTGNITGRNRLNDYYRKSKIFLFPSRFESFAIAGLEAAAFGNYIIATDTGAVRDLTNNGQYGFICPESIEFKQHEAAIEKSIKRQLTLIINNEININGQLEKQAAFIKKNFMMSAIIKYPALKKWAAEKGKKP